MIKANQDFVVAWGGRCRVATPWLDEPRAACIAAGAPNELASPNEVRRLVDASVNGLRDGLLRMAASARRTRHCNSRSALAQTFSGSLGHKARRQMECV